MKSTYYLPALTLMSQLLPADAGFIATIGLATGGLVVMAFGSPVGVAMIVAAGPAIFIPGPF
jgi:hypothetical protein